MKIWLFAGGGVSEIEGLTPLLKREFPDYEFERCLPPSKKPGPKPRRISAGESPIIQGETGISLLARIKEKLGIKLRGKTSCDVIFIFDDFDYEDEIDNQKKNDALTKREKFEGFIAEVKEEFETLKDITFIVGFAKPEIEAWIIADWDNTIAKDSDFRRRSPAMQHYLATNYDVLFDQPEEFGCHPENQRNYNQKLSNCIIEASKKCGSLEDIPFSKGVHTPRLLSSQEYPLSINIVQSKCPEFRYFWNELKNLSQGIAESD